VDISEDQVFISGH